MTGIPSSLKACATALLPLAMPPVKTIRTSRLLATGTSVLQIAGNQCVAPQHRDPSGNCQIGSIRNRDVAIATAEQDQANADHRAGKRRQKDNQQQRLPSEPSSKGRE